MEDQERNDKPKQTASDKAIEHQAERLVNIERPSNQPTKSRAFGVFNAYLILLGTIIAFGVLAFYTGHKLTADVIFYLSIPLLGLIPIALMIYLLPVIRKQVTASLDRFENSHCFAFLRRHFEGFARVYYVFCLYQIVEGIRIFPRWQRGALILISIAGYNFMTMRIIEREIILRMRIDKLRDLLYDVSDIVVYLAKKQEREPEGYKPSKEPGGSK